MSEMDDTQREQFEDLAAAYALGALSDEERQEFEVRLAEHPDLQAEVEDLGALANLLALTPQEYEPSANLRGSLLRSVGAAPEVYLAPQREPRRRRAALARLLFGPGGLAAAAAVVAVVGLLVWSLSLWDANEDLRAEVGDQRREAEALRSETEVLRSEAESRKTLELRGSGVAENASGEVLLTGEGQAVLVATDLPPPPEGQVYEAWVVRDGAPEPAALFLPSEGEATTAVAGSLEGAEAVTITVEPEGGSQRPTSDPVLTASLA